MPTYRRILAVAVCLVAALAAPAIASATIARHDVTVTSLSVSLLNRDETVPATVAGTGFTTGTKASVGPGVTVTVTAVSPTALSLELSAADGAATGLRALRVEVPHHAAVYLPKALRVGFAPVLARWAVGDGATYFRTSLVRPTFSAVPRLDVAGKGVSAAASLAAGGVLDVALSVAPTAPTGWRGLTITEGAAVWRLKDGIKVRAAPEITSVTPLGQGEQHVTVKVLGRNFEVCSTPPTLVVGGPGVTVNWVSSALGTLLYASLSVAASTPLGPRSVTMTNCDSGGRSTAKAAFSVLGAPEVSSVQPVAVGATRVVTVRGTNLTPATTLAASGTDVTFSGVVYESPTKLRATVTASSGAATGARVVTATDSGGLQSAAVGALTIDAPPTTASLSPQGVGANRDVLVTVHGTGFQVGATVGVLAGGVPVSLVKVSPTKVRSPSELEVLVAASARVASGEDSLVVVNPDGGESAGIGFVTDPAPSITSLTPSTTTAGALVVDFAGAVGAPAQEAYTLLACTNATLTEGCRSHLLGAPGTQTVGGLVPGTRYVAVVEAPATGGFYGSRSSLAVARATLQLAAPSRLAVAPSSDVAGAVVVRFTAPVGAPAAQRYEAQACRDAAMTQRCVVGAVRSGTALRGLAPGVRYHVRVIALASPGYLAAHSTESGAVPATLQLQAPVVRSAVLRGGHVTVTFAAPKLRASSQRYSLRACENAAMSKGCVTVRPFVSGEQASYSPSTCFVEVTALASSGYLAATSKVLRAS